MVDQVDLQVEVVHKLEESDQLGIRCVLPQPAPSDYTPYGNLGGATMVKVVIPLLVHGINQVEAEVVVLDLMQEHLELELRWSRKRNFLLSLPVIEPGIPASVRPTWTPVVGPTGVFNGGGGSSSYYTSEWSRCHFWWWWKSVMTYN